MSCCIFFKSSRLVMSNYLCLLILHLLLQVEEHLVELLASVLGLKFSSYHPPQCGRGRLGVFVVMDMVVR